MELATTKGQEATFSQSFDAWNRHDADAILALYAKGGTYSAPRAGSQALTGQAIADYAKKVFTAYPDMSVEIISIGNTGGGLVASQWVLHGTHTGPYFDGSPPTGRTLTLPVPGLCSRFSTRVFQALFSRALIADLIGIGSP